MVSASANAANFTWDADGAFPIADGAGNWNPAGGTNWFDGGSFGAWGNTNNDVAFFGVANGAADTINVGSVIANGITFNAPGSGTYTLAGGTITLGGATPTITTNVYGIINSAIAGSNGLTKTGGAAEALYLDGNNTYAGVTNLNTGYLVVRHANALGSAADGTIVANGATLQLENGGGGDVAIAGEGVTITGTGVGGTRGALASWAGNNSWGGTITMAGNSTILVNSGTLTVGGSVGGGAFALTKTGGGSLTFNGTNTYTGDTTVSAGVLNLGAAAPTVLGNLVMNGGDGTYLRTQQADQFGAGSVANFTSAAGAWNRFEMFGKNQTLAGINTGTSATLGGGVIQNSEANGAAGSDVTLTLNGSGTYLFNGHLRDFGSTASGINKLALVKNGTGTQTLAGTVITYSGGTTVNNGTLIIDMAARSGATTIYANTVTAPGTFELSNTNATIDNLLIQNSSIAGSGTLAKSGAGYLTFWTNTSIASFTGTMDVRQGTLGFNNMGAGASAPQATLNIAAGATADLRYNSALVVDKLTGSGILGHSFTDNVTVTIGANNGSSTFAGSIQNAAGILNLTKTGTGTLTLTGASTYNGLTTVNGGILEVTTGGSISNTSQIFANGVGTGTLSITGGAVTATINSVFALNIGNIANQPGAVNISSGSLTLSGATSGIVMGNGGAGATADFTQTGGTVSVGNGGIYLANNAGATSTMTLTGGSFTTTGGDFNIGARDTSTLTIGGTANVTHPGSMWIGRAFDGLPNFTSTLNMNGGTVTQGGSFFVVGNTSGASGSGVYNQSGGTYNFTGNSGVYIGNAGSGSGTMTVSGGTFNQTGGFDFRIAANGANGTVTVSGTGTIAVNSAMWIGYSAGGLGTFNMNGGTVTQSGQFFVVGNNTNANIYNQTGGTYTFSGVNGSYLGNGSSGSGTMTVSGGTFTQTLDVMRVGQNGTATGTLTVGGGVGLANVNAPLISFANNSNSATGIVNLLTNGVLTTGAVQKPTAGSGTFNFDGGTLRASGNSATFMNGLTAANIKNGGAIIDSQGFAITIAQPLLNFAGATTDSLTKIGTGTLTLSGASTYTGGTILSQGTLVHANNAATGSPTTGSITLGDANTGANNLDLQFTAGVTNSGAATVAKPITVTSQGTGTATITLNQGTAFVNASVNLNKALTIRTTGGGAQYGLMGQLTGPGAGAGNESIVFSAPGGTTFYYTAGYTGAGVLANTYLGNTRFTGGGNINTQNLAYLSNTAGYQNGVIPDTGSVTVDAGTTWTNGHGVETIDVLTGGGTVTRNGTNYLAGTPILTVGAGGGSGTFSGVMQDGGGAFSFAKTGAGTQTLTGENTFTGGTTVNAGTLVLTDADSDSVGVLHGTVTVNSGATLRATSANSFGWGGGTKIDTLNISGGLVDNIATGDQGWGIAINLTGGTLQSNGGTSSGATGQLFSLGGGSSINSLASATTSTIAGRIQLRESNPGDILPFTVANGAANIDLDVTATITQAAAGRGITKFGPGTMNLTAANTYSGTTTVNGGTLTVNNTTGSGTGSGAVVVQNGGTLGGTGTITTTGLTVQNGGTLAPGNSPGNLTVNGPVVLSAGSLFGVEVNVGGVTTVGNGTNGTDLLTVNGTIDLTGALLTGTYGGGLNNLFLGNLNADNMTWIVNNDLADTIVGTFANTTPSPGLTGLFGTPAYFGSVGGQPVAVFYNSQFGVTNAGGLSGGNDLLLIAIPEPSRALLALLALVPLVMRRRK